MVLRVNGASQIVAGIGVICTLSGADSLGGSTTHTPAVAAGIAGQTFHFNIAFPSSYFGLPHCMVFSR
jgi:hypothetical protein